MAKNSEIFTAGLWTNNPILFQTLGVCSALAVTAQVRAAAVMALSLTVVLVLSNVIISAMRNHIPSNIRMIVELIVIATLVILTDQVLKAFMYDVSKELSVFVGLIITNCIVMGRAEAFALGNPILPSAVDGLANGLGYGLILILVGAFREVLGAGKILGMQVVPESLYEAGYQNMGLMVLAPGAFFLIGLIFWGHREISAKKAGH
jgi:Na+-transporting NADH:ubiquinone oxidoreductase subunit D